MATPVLTEPLQAALAHPDFHGLQRPVDQIKSASTFNAQQHCTALLPQPLVPMLLPALFTSSFHNLDRQITLKEMGIGANTGP